VCACVDRNRKTSKKEGNNANTHTGITFDHTHLLFVVEHVVVGASLNHHLCGPGGCVVVKGPPVHAGFGIVDLEEEITRGGGGGG
jgi:hypothetical protein